jgi:hypothetical protein
MRALYLHLGSNTPYAVTDEPADSGVSKSSRNVSPGWFERFFPRLLTGR